VVEQQKIHLVFIELEINMYMGFKKLKEKVEKSGAKNPAAVAAKIGMKKYGKEKMMKAAHSGKSLAHVKPKKSYGI